MASGAPARTRATVYCLHAWPAARPSRQRPRCNLLGALRLASCGGREWRGREAPARDGPLGRAEGGVPKVRHSRPPGFDQGASGPRKASRIWASGLGFLPSPHPPTASAQKEEGVEGKATPLAAGSVRAPGARGGRAPRGPAEAAACVVLFLDSFQLWGKKHLSQGTKKRGGGGGG